MSRETVSSLVDLRWELGNIRLAGMFGANRPFISRAAERRCQPRADPEIKTRF